MPVLLFVSETNEEQPAKAGKGVGLLGMSGLGVVVTETQIPKPFDFGLPSLELVSSFPG